MWMAWQVWRPGRRKSVKMLEEFRLHFMVVDKVKPTFARVFGSRSCLWTYCWCLLDKPFSMCQNAEPHKHSTYSSSSEHNFYQPILCAQWALFTSISLTSTTAGRVYCGLLIQFPTKMRAQHKERRCCGWPTVSSFYINFTSLCLYSERIVLNNFLNFLFIQTRNAYFYCLNMAMAVFFSLSTSSSNCTSSHYLLPS